MTTARKAGFMHMSIGKRLLLSIIDSGPDEWKHIVTGAKTKQEARDLIENGPEWHPMGNCPEFDYETGKCPGHKSKPS